MWLSSTPIKSTGKLQVTIWLNRVNLKQVHLSLKTDFVKFYSFCLYYDPGKIPIEDHLVGASGTCWAAPGSGLGEGSPGWPAATPPPAPAPGPHPGQVILMTFQLHFTADHCYKMLFSPFCPCGSGRPPSARGGRRQRTCSWLLARDTTHIQRSE